jgi:hypothetical protein
MWTNFDTSHLPVNAQSPDQYFTETQHALAGVSYSIKTANQAYIDVLNDVGANKTLNSDGTINVYQDTKDSADIQMILNDTYSGSFYDNKSTIPYPSIPQNTRPAGYDTDFDGMPNIWEIAKGFDPNSDDSNLDNDGDGYTNLEEYMNLIDL